MFMRRYLISPHVRFLNSQDGIALLDVASGRFYSLNKVGGEIWQCLVALHDTAEIESHLSSLFREAPERIHRDVIRYLGNLKDLGLVRCEELVTDQ